MTTVFVDTDCDVTPEFCKAHGFKLISMPYSIEGEEIFPYESFEKFEVHEFYEKLRSGILPNTSSISEYKYREYFEPEFKAGNDILYIHFSPVLSCTFTVMNSLVEQLLEEYPERKFDTINTKTITIGALNIICEISDMLQQGKSIDEIKKWNDENTEHFPVYLFADDLKFFHHSGRVNGLSALMGSILGIRPVIHIDSEGHFVVLGKERGRIKALQKIMEYIDELGDHIKEHRVIIGQADCEDIAAKMIEMLHEKYGNDLNIEVVPVNPTAGSHCGPDTLGVSFYSKHR